MDKRAEFGLRSRKCVFNQKIIIFWLQKNTGLTPQTRPEVSRNPPPPPPPPPAQAGPSSPSQPGKIPYFVPDPDNIPSQRIGNQNTRGSPPEDNFKYEKNPNFDEKLVVPKFYQGETFDQNFSWESLKRSEWLCLGKEGRWIVGDRRWLVAYTHIGYHCMCMMVTNLFYGNQLTPWKSSHMTL